MTLFLDKIIVYIANLFSPEIFFSQRILFAKILIATFLSGFISAFAIQTISRWSWKKLKKKYKELKRIRRMSAQKLAGAQFVGEVTQYLSNLQVVIIDIKKHSIKVGDTLLFKGNNTNTTERADSLQINRKDVSFAKKGKEIGLKITAPVKAGDLVYKKK